MIYSVASHVGKVRRNNEDYCYGEVLNIENEKLGIFALADGMGGHNKGEVASKLSVEGMVCFLRENLIQNNSVEIEFIEDILKQGYEYVNTSIYEKSIQYPEYQGMGTTLVVAVMYMKNLYVANVGDSRCYLSRGDILKQITTDHSVISELIRVRAITEEEAKTHPARNQITRAIGTDERVLVDLYKVSLNKGDKILLSSDGLTSFVKHDIIKNIMMNTEEEVDIISNDLINIANEESGRDNITVIVIEQE